MPNYVDSDLFVTGPAEDIAAFKLLAHDVEEEELLSADRFIPYPEKFKEMDRLSKQWWEEATNYAQHTAGKGKNWWDLSAEEQIIFINIRGQQASDGYNQGGYEWCCENWGTKWGFCHTNLDDESDTSLFYNFDTAWSAPVPIIIAMSKKFPTLHFEMRSYEGAMGWQLILEVEGGKVLLEENSNYPGPDDDPEELRGG